MRRLAFNSAEFITDIHIGLWRSEILDAGLRRYGFLKLVRLSYLERIGDVPAGEILKKVLAAYPGTMMSLIPKFIWRKAKYILDFELTNDHPYGLASIYSDS